MTKFISYYARRSNLLAVIFLVFGTSIFLIPTAQAQSAWTSVICANPAGEQRTFQIGWDNSNQFFADKGYIPRLYCEGGYANPYRTYISDTLNGGALGYYAGVVPVPVVTPQETTTATADTSTATADTSTATSDTSTTTTDTSTTTTDTSTTTSDTSTVDTSTTNTDTTTSTTDTATVEPAPVDGSTATSQPEPQPTPTPPAPPVVEPEPAEEEVTAPEEEEIVPEPEAEKEVIVPAEEPEEEQIVPEEEPEIVPEPEPEVEQTVTLDNGVVLTQEQAVAIALLGNPAELLQEIFTNPGAAFAALSQVGADMSPEVRERSEEVVVAAVIVGNIASAAGAAAYRRKP